MKLNLNADYSIIELLMIEDEEKFVDFIENKISKTMQEYVDVYKESFDIEIFLDSSSYSCCSRTGGLLEYILEELNPKTKKDYIMCGYIFSQVCVKLNEVFKHFSEEMIKRKVLLDTLDNF